LATGYETVPFATLQALSIGQSLNLGSV
jgi:hypothetical protein